MKKMALESFHLIREKIVFFRKEIATLRKRREELEDELRAKGNSAELIASIVGLDDLREKTYDSLISQYEDIIVALEVLANIKPDERLPST